MLVMRNFNLISVQSCIYLLNSTLRCQRDHFTPAFSVTCIGDIFVHLSTCHLSTCYLNGCLTVNRQFFTVLAEEMTNKYMLLAGWEVRIGKNCDRGLENAARGRRPRAAFSLYGPTLRRPITFLSFYSCRKLAYKFFYRWVCLRNFAAIESAYTPSTVQTIRKKCNEQTSE